LHAHVNHSTEVTKCIFKKNCSLNAIFVNDLYDEKQMKQKWKTL